MIAYTPSPSDEYAAPTNAANFMDFPYVKSGGVYDTIGFNVPRRDIKSNFDWLYTNNETLAQRSAGTFTHFMLPQIASAAQSTVFYVVLDLTAEFKGPIDPALEPMLGSLRVDMGKSVRDNPRPDSYIGLVKSKKEIDEWKEVNDVNDDDNKKEFKISLRPNMNTSWRKR